MAGTFEIYKDKAGEFRFRLKATNGQVIVTVGGYKTKASAIEGIESVQKNAPGAKIEDLGEVSSVAGVSMASTPAPSGEPMAKGTYTFPKGHGISDLAHGQGAAGTMHGPGWDND
jgi:uncharacterized protein YegP (UPF0339 family)